MENTNSLFRSRDWLSANQGPVFPHHRCLLGLCFGLGTEHAYAQTNILTHKRTQCKHVITPTPEREIEREGDRERDRERKCNRTRYLGQSGTVFPHHLKCLLGLGFGLGTEHIDDSADYMRETVVVPGVSFILKL
eukprot:sb/3474693/